MEASIARRLSGVRPVAAFSAAEHLLALVVLPALAAFWVLLPTLAASAPPGDNVEQLNWSHGLEWGYYKHPPLSTWMLHLAISIFGRSAATSYGTGVVCVLVALYASYRVSRELADARSALFAVLLTSCVSYFCTKGWWFNHNTAMLPFVAISTWLYVRVLRGGNTMAWLGLGLTCALGMLVKYQFVLFASGYFIGLSMAGVWRRDGAWQRALAGLAVGAAVFAPHVLWLAQHDYSTLRYASGSLLANLDVWHRAANIVSYLWQQVARAIPALIAFGAAQWASTRIPPDRVLAEQPLDNPVLLRAMTVAGVFPFVAIPVMATIGGSALQSHWGTSTFLPLIPLLAVGIARAPTRLALRAVLASVLVVHTLCGAWVVWRHFEADPQTDSAAFPAATFARQAETTWAAYADNDVVPLVIGPSFEAGAIAAFMRGQPPVLVDGRREEAPWITERRLRSCGGVLVHPPTPERKCVDYASLADDTIAQSLVVVNVGASRQAAMCIGVVIPAAGDGCSN